MYRESTPTAPIALGAAQSTYDYDPPTAPIPFAEILQQTMQDAWAHGSRLGQQLRQQQEAEAYQQWQRAEWERQQHETRRGMSRGQKTAWGVFAGIVGLDVLLRRSTERTRESRRRFDANYAEFEARQAELNASRPSHW